MSSAVLSCRICESTRPLAPLSRCAECSGPLDVSYAPNGAGGVLLPHLDPGSAPTPLVPARELSDALGVDLRLKLETANPTRSFKDRMAASAVAAARGFGIETLLCASSGNLGAAVASRCAAAGLEGVVLTPADGDEPLDPGESHGATVFTVRGTLEDCRRLERELEHLFPWGFLEGNLAPFAVEGIKSIAHEIAEQLDGKAPDAIVSPVGSGALLAKLAQGFVELAGVPPRMYGAQPAGCPPLAAAWADERPPSRVMPDTVARSLAVGDPSYGELALGAARMSGGSITAVAEEAIGSSTTMLAETTGVDADPAGGVAFSAFLELVRTGAIAAGERVVLVVTGAAPPRRSAASAPARQIEAETGDFLAALGVAAG